MHIYIYIYAWVLCLDDMFSLFDRWMSAAVNKVLPLVSVPSVGLVSVPTRLLLRLRIIASSSSDYRSRVLRHFQIEFLSQYASNSGCPLGLCWSVSEDLEPLFSRCTPWYFALMTCLVLTRDIWYWHLRHSVFLQLYWLSYKLTTICRLPPNLLVLLRKRL